MENNLIYLATPYTHSDPKIVEQRFNDACIIAGKLISKGFKVFSPIAHSHQLAIKTNLPINFEYWSNLNELWLSKCDILVIAKMDGFMESKGIRNEYIMAKVMGKDIYFLDPNSLEFNHVSF